MKRKGKMPMVWDYESQSWRQAKHSPKQSDVIGVTWVELARRWRASIPNGRPMKSGRKEVSLGSYLYEVEAVMARRQAEECKEKNGGVLPVGYKPNVIKSKKKLPCSKK